MYRIIEARIEYRENKLTRVTVLVDMNLDFSDVRAIFATDKPIGGYAYIAPNAQLTDGLLQVVAGSGRETMDRDEIFPNWKKKQVI